MYSPFLEAQKHETIADPTYANRMKDNEHLNKISREAFKKAKKNEDK